MIELNIRTLDNISGSGKSDVKPLDTKKILHLLDKLYEHTPLDQLFDALLKAKNVHIMLTN